MEVFGSAFIPPIRLDRQDERATSGNLDKSTSLHDEALMASGFELTTRQKQCNHEFESLIIYLPQPGMFDTRAFGDGPRNFEPWSSGEDDTCHASEDPLCRGADAHEICRGSKSSTWCGGLKRCVNSQVSSSSLDRGSKL
ncbi:hypothetical protein TNCV_765811 [Trichonephila clavipes]|nr:hypothetical protein TNCV_765811 [Trichonephila clavipes]